MLWWFPLGSPDIVTVASDKKVYVRSITYDVGATGATARVMSSLMVVL